MRKQEPSGADFSDTYPVVRKIRTRKKRIRKIGVKKVRKGKYTMKRRKK